MYKFLLAITCSLVFTCTAHAQQPVNRTAMKLAELTIGESFENYKLLLNTMFESLEKKATVAGKMDRASSIFVDELKNAFNRENLIRAMATLWSDAMTDAELSEALTFMQSPVGRKFRVASENMKDLKNLAPIFLDACNRSKTRLLAVGETSGELVKFCSQF